MVEKIKQIMKRIKPNSRVLSIIAIRKKQNKRTMSSINNSTASPMQEIPKYQSALVSLVKLRYTDYDAFMERLYEALRGDFKEAIHDLTPVEGKQQALDTMIDYFQNKEEYEKCAELKRLKDSLLN